MARFTLILGDQRPRALIPGNLPTPSPICNQSLTRTRFGAIFLSGGNQIDFLDDFRHWNASSVCLVFTLTFSHDINSFQSLGLTAQKNSGGGVMDVQWEDVMMWLPWEDCPLGVHKSVHDETKWVISHIPTGLRAFPAMFADEASAQVCLHAMSPEHPAWLGTDPIAVRDAAAGLMLAAAKSLGVPVHRIQ